VLHFDNIFDPFPYRLNGFSDWNREPAVAEGGAATNQSTRAGCGIHRRNKKGHSGGRCGLNVTAE
jgi:hypothetical protein